MFIFWNYFDQHITSSRRSKPAGPSIERLDAQRYPIPPRTQGYGTSRSPHPMYTSPLRMSRHVSYSPHQFTNSTQTDPQEEFYSVHTPVSSPEFLNCLLSTSSTKGPLTPARLREIVVASQTPENKARIKTDVQYVVDTFGTYGAPWIVAYRVPPEDDPEKEEFNCFFGLDRFEAMGWWYVLCLLLFSRE